MLNEAPGNLRVNLRTLLKRANCKSLYSSTKHVQKITKKMFKNSEKIVILLEKNSDFAS